MSAFSDIMAAATAQALASLGTTCAIATGEGTTVATGIPCIPGQIQSGATAENVGIEIDDTCTFEIETASILSKLGRPVRRSDVITCDETGYAGDWIVTQAGDVDGGMSRIVCSRAITFAAGKSRTA